MNNGSTQTSLRVAVFADSAPQSLARALEKALTEQGFKPDIRAWAFASPLAAQTELATFAPDFAVLWHCAETAETRGFPDLTPVVNLPYRFLVCNMVTMDDGSCGSHALLFPESLRARITDWNTRLLELARTRSNIIPVDLDGLQARLGRAATFDPRLWETVSLALTPNATELLAGRLAGILGAAYGRLRKVLVTDLDGTLWDGIVSEDGPGGIRPDAPGRRRYRAWLKALARRGILLAVASRNDPETALAAFAHPDMDMMPEAFVAFEASWEPKSVMLRRIAQRLHTAVDAMVFIDDRPEQRREVRNELPEMAVPELPEDPALWPDILAGLNLFETLTVTEDDVLRADSLRADDARTEVAETLSQEAYLASLEQELLPEPLGPGNYARAAQLTQRCNQFNMRGTRHTEAELAQMKGWVYRLRDRFGDMGVVSAVILEGDVIETWVLSCRALNRDIERLILDHLKNLGPLRGDYVPTGRNDRCRGIYETNGVPQS